MSDTARGFDDRSGTPKMSFSEHNVVATYASPDDARAALTMLERKGVEGADIELLGPGVARSQQPLTNEELREVDMEASKDIGKRFTAVSVVVSIVGIVVGGLLGWIIAGDATGLLVGALGGWIVGGILGFLFGGYGSLPTNPQWEDTFASDHGETMLAVRSENPEDIEVALDALRGTDAKRLRRCGRDGHLRDL